MTSTKPIITAAQPTHISSFSVSHSFPCTIQAFSPPELSVIGSDISTPASHSTDTGEHKEARSPDHHTRKYTWDIWVYWSTNSTTAHWRHRGKNGLWGVFLPSGMTPGISDFKNKKFYISSVHLEVRKNEHQSTATEKSHSVQKYASDLKFLLLKMFIFIT